MSSKGSCCADSCCCEAAPRPKRLLEVEFLYLDLDTCTWCQETERNLEEAVAQARPALAAMGVEIVVKKRQVRSAQEAAETGMVASPTVRIDGEDVQPQPELARCGPCSELCGEDTDCRVWRYDGQTYTAPPVPLLLQSILRKAVS